MDNLLSFLGLAKKAGKLAIGEEPAGASCRARDCRVLLLAKDAAGPTCRRARHFADAGQCLLVQLPFDKLALGRALGRSVCAMVALEDIGFADALMRRLADADPQYAEASQRLQVKAQRAAERRKEQQQHEKKLRQGLGHKKEAPPAEAAAVVQTPAPAPAPAKPKTAPRKPYAKPGEGAARKPYAKPGEGAARKPYAKPGEGAARKPYAKPGEGAPRKPYAKPGEGAARKPYAKPGETKRFPGSRPVKKGKGSPQSK